MKGNIIHKDSYNKKECNTSYKKEGVPSHAYDSFNKEKNIYIAYTDDEISVSYWLIERKSIKREISRIEQQFNELANKWREETGLFSTSFHKINDSYLEVISLGKEVVPFLLRDLQNIGGANWHTALKIITKENPISEQDLNSTKKIKEGWTAWGRKNNLI